MHRLDGGESKVRKPCAASQLDPPIPRDAMLCQQGWGRRRCWLSWDLWDNKKPLVRAQMGPAELPSNTTWGGVGQG